MNKKAYYFSLDAFVALLIILGVVVFIKPSVTQSSYETSVQDDVLTALSTLKIGEINNSYVKQLISAGNITDLNQSVLEQIGEFYVLPDSLPLARNIAQNILDDLNLNENVGIWYGDTLVASTNKSAFQDAERILTSRQVISGIQGGNSTKGYASRAFLASENKVDYFYFGGYVGDGNITVRLDGQVIGANIEGVFSRNFDLYINNQFAGSYIPLPNIPYNISLAEHLNKFINGANNLSFKSNNPLYIAGGYIKVVYNNSEAPQSINKKYFPGIDGFINIYDSFYVPGTLISLEAYLHYNSSQNIFFTIGNTEVYRGNSSGSETEVTLNNAQLDAFLDYNYLSDKTIPYRLGLENVSYFFNHSGSIDVFSVTDLSGSMTYNCRGCNVVSCTPVGNCKDSDGCKICDARASNRALVDGILNTPFNRVGLAGYETATQNKNAHPLSNDNSSLRNVIDSQWIAGGNTCICCGINRATYNFYDNLVAYYNLDDNILDKGVNSNNASVSGSPIYVPGIINNGLEFNGSNYLTTKNFRDVGLGGTISFWFKLNQTFNSTNTITQGLWSNYRDNNENAFIAFKGSDLGVGGGLTGSIQARLEGRGVNPITGTDYINTVARSWNVNTWYHLVLTWDGSSAAVYINGIQDGSLYTDNNLVGFRDGNNSFGRAQFDTAITNFSVPNNFRYFNGALDEIRVYKRPLSLKEIQGLANFGGSCGNNISETGEVCDGDSEYCDFSGERGRRVCNSGCNGFEGCGLDNTYMSTVVMTDGGANRRCLKNRATTDLDGSGVINARDDAIQASIVACTTYGIAMNAVGFAISDGTIRNSLENVARCGGGYYNADVNELIEIYTNITQQIIQSAYYEQTIVGEGFSTKLYPDSYLLIDYNKIIPPGMVITAETPIFGNNITQGSFFVPNDTNIYEAKAISYSGSKWTSLVQTYNSSSFFWEDAFDLSDFNSTYINLGDPYVVNIPAQNLVYENNTVKVQIGTSSINIEGGSPYDKIIYSLTKNISSYTPIVASAEGCIWTIEFEDGSNSTINVPSNYTGTDACSYTLGDHDSPNQNDAIDYSVYLLLLKMDLNSDGRIETKFTEQDLTIIPSTITGIPFTWETEVQARVWY